MITRSGLSHFHLRVQGVCLWGLRLDFYLSLPHKYGSELDYFHLENWYVVFWYEQFFAVKLVGMTTSLVVPHHSDATCFLDRVKHGMEMIEFLLSQQESNLDHWYLNCTSSASPTCILILLPVLHFISSRSPRSPQTYSSLILPLFQSHICLPHVSPSSLNICSNNWKNTLSVTDGMLTQVCVVYMKGKMWLTSEWWCLSGDGGAHEGCGEKLIISDGTVTLIPEWILNHTPRQRWRQEELNIDSRIRKIL